MAKKSNGRKLEEELRDKINFQEVQIASLNSTMEEKDKEIRRLKHQYQSKPNPSESEEHLKDQINRQNKEIASLQSDIRERDKEVTYHKDQCKNLGKQLTYMTQERNDLVQRLSQEMSAKIGMNETSLENISIKNRPMKVAEEYEILCSNSWLSAKDALDNGFDGSNEQMICMLMDVMLEVQDIAMVKYQEMTNLIYEMITLRAEVGAAASLGSKKFPIMKLEEPRVQERTSLDQVMMVEKTYDSIPDGLKISISDFLRATCDTADIKGLFEAVKTKFLARLERFHEDISKRPPNQLNREKSLDSLNKTIVKIGKENQEDIKTYIHDCARLTWKMAAQRPPMTFDNKTGIDQQWMGERHQHVYYNSKNPEDPGNVVKYYVFPALKHKDYVMKLGTVYIAPKSEMDSKDKKEDDEH